MAESGSSQDYEKLASFYLGKKYALADKKLLDEKVLYDAKDLTTHAMCVGMTGSGKTGLCLSLLEEAAIDGIPAICIDPKGDLGNLLLAFPKMAASDFKEWIDPSEAARAGAEPDEYAATMADRWRQGLASWDQGLDRVQKFCDSVDITIYTPGSNAGIPITVLKSFDAPPPEIMDDAELLRERIAGAASGLLTLLGIDADPLTSREHILLSNLFDNAWRAGKNLDLPSLIRSIQSPPLEKVGVFDLESFYPAADRLKLSISLNNLLASPSFAGWLEGQPLDVKSLLHTPQGKPRLSIISIAHLNDSERMFFVTILLNELLSWMRTQPGTSSLRALFYMDEVFGYFPPSAKPPSKPPMLVLLKQARAFGLGIVLATQNPVDLDYKGLSNIGTWFLGRLQTQRDKDRVLDGLEGAATQTGSTFNRSQIEQTLSALGSRVFYMSNVHDDGPTIFQTRWALSYLRGPLSRDQIKSLMDLRRARPQEPSASSQTAVKETPASQPAGSVANHRPLVPNDVEERFWCPSKTPNSTSKIVYRPGLLATVSCHYVRVSADLDVWLDQALLVAIRGELPNDIWNSAREVPLRSLELSAEPEGGYQFTDLPSELLNDREYRRWEKDLKDHLYRRVPIQLFQCAELDATSQPGQDELDARLAWQQRVRELRDEKTEKLREQFARRLSSLESKIRTAEQRVAREQAQYDQEKWKTALSFGQTILGAFLGNKISSRSATTGRGIGRATQQRTDVVLASETLEDLTREKVDLENECERAVLDLQASYQIESLRLEPVEYACRKGDIKIHLLSLLWIPWQVDASGIAEPLVDWP